MNTQIIGTENQKNLDLEFQKVADDLSLVLSQYGIRCKSYAPGLPQFSSLPEEKKIQAISNIKFYYNLCLEEIADGYSLKDSPSFTWRALRHFGYAPTSDLFEKIKADHIVEIYANDGMQVFRNLKYFDFCSYTLEEIYSLEWYHLYERPEEMHTLAAESFKKIYTGEEPGNFDPQMPKHIVRELQSADLLHMEYGLDLMGPLFKNRKPVAAIVLESARLLNN